MSARRELYHFHDMLKLEAETRRVLDRPGSDFASIALKASVAPTLMAQGKTAFARKFPEQAMALAQSIQGEGSGLDALPALQLRLEERRVGREWVRTCRSRWGQ